MNIRMDKMNTITGDNRPQAKNGANQPYLAQPAQPPLGRHHYWL